MSVTTTHPVTAAALTDEEFFHRRAYAFLPQVEAAKDPRTPEEHLLQMLPDSSDTFFAMVERRPMGKELARQLVRYAGVVHALRKDRARRNESVAQAAQLPHVTDWWLRDLARKLDRWAPGFDDAVLTLVRHPSSTEQVAADALCLAAGGFGTGTALEQSVAATGRLAPTALRLLRTERQRRAEVPAMAAESTLAIIGELDEAIGDNLPMRRIVASLGATWCGNRADLLAISGDIARST
jgi:hypothetical protein